MLKIDKIKVMNLDNAIRGMRNPMNSWEKADSAKGEDGKFVLGENDKDLAKRLIAAGEPHPKFLRQIFISMDVTGPRYWWTEMDQYKHIVTDSCSTMHKIADHKFSAKDFSCENMSKDTIETMKRVVWSLNQARDKYLESKDKTDWWQMIVLLPQSYNQMRTLTMSYADALNIYRQRRGHKLDEWNQFIGYLGQLPCMTDFMNAINEKEQK